MIFLTNESASVTAGQLQQILNNTTNTLTTSFMSQITAAIYAVLTIIGFWLLFESKKVEGWKAIIPIYSTYLSYKLFFKKSKFWVLFVSTVLIFVLLIALLITAAATNGSAMTDSTAFSILGMFALILILFIVILVISIQFDISICKKYNMGFLFILGMIFISPVFIFILGLQVKRGIIKAA